MFSMDSHGIVQPIAESCVAVVLDYWQIFEGPNSTRPGPFLRRYGLTGIDTAGQVLLKPDGTLVDGPRSWKTGNGFRAEEIAGAAATHSPASPRKSRLRLSWFLVDEGSYRADLGPDGPLARYCSAEGALTSARKVRRPLVRVDGSALESLEEHQELLRRHVRQFWWQRGDRQAPARLVVLDTNSFPDGARADAATGNCSTGKVPEVLAVIDLGGGVDLETTGPILDECWRRYMERRPSNADNLTFARSNIPIFKSIDDTIRELARSGRLLAPGGRKLLAAPRPLERTARF